MSDTLFLFSHYGSWDWVHQNFNALVRCEGIDNVLPISEDDHGLDKTCALRKYGNLFGFDGHDKRWFCDALLYHWALNNEEILAKKQLIFLIESDVFWGLPFDEFKDQIIKCENIALSCWFCQPPEGWPHFQPYLNHEYYNQMRGMTLGSIVAFDAKLLMAMALKFRADKQLWDIGINELRMGTIANMCGATFQALPTKVCRYNHFEQGGYLLNPFGLMEARSFKGEGTFHPVKYADADLKTRSKS